MESPAGETASALVEQGRSSTLKKVQRFVSVLMTCALTWAFVHTLGHIVRPTHTDQAYTQVETLHSLPRNSVEVMIYGSSHAYRGFNTMEMYDRYGIGAYNYGMLWQRINTTHLFLKDSLEVQTPKVVLIESFNCNELLEDTNISAEIYYSRFIHEEEAKAKYLRQCFGEDKERYLSFYMPLCAFHENWSTLDKDSFKELTVGKALRRKMGASMYKHVEKITMADYQDLEQLPLSANAEKELLEMVQLCKEKNIEVLFYTVPSAKIFNYSEAMKKFAKENGCAYVDLYELVDETGLDGQTDFSDISHLNQSGATKVADYMGQYLVDHYELTDFRTIPDNLWEQAKDL